MEKVISIVGAGGKTTLVHKLAREYHRSGKGVLVTTTTHMYVEADTDLSCDFFALRDKIIKDGYCMAGQKISEKKISEQSKSKMCGLRAAAGRGQTSARSASRAQQIKSPSDER